MTVKWFAAGAIPNDALMPLAAIFGALAFAHDGVKFCFAAWKPAGSAARASPRSSLRAAFSDAGRRFESCIAHHRAQQSTPSDYFSSGFRAPSGGVTSVLLGWSKSSLTLPLRSFLSRSVAAATSAADQFSSLPTADG